MGIVSRQQIVAAADLKYVDVNVPEWGGDVRVRVMSGIDRDRFEREWQELDGKIGEGFRQKLIAKCLCDENLNRLFTDKEIDELGKKSSDVLSRIWTECMRVNGFSKEAGEDLAKNSESAPSGASTSGSPSPSDAQSESSSSDATVSN